MKKLLIFLTLAHGLVAGFAAEDKKATTTYVVGMTGLT